MNEDCSQDADCYVAFIIVIFRSLTTLNRANCRVHSPHRNTNVSQQCNRVIFGECYCIYLLFHSRPAQVFTVCCDHPIIPPHHRYISTVACNFLNTYADILQRVSLHLQTSHFVFSTRLLTIVTHPRIPGTMTHNLQLQPLSAAVCVTAFELFNFYFDVH